MTRATLLGTQFVEIPAPVCDGAKRLFAFWQQQTPAGDLPGRDAFSFDALRDLRLLGHTFVIEPLDGGTDWRYRLLGSDIVWMFGRDVTNVPFTQHFEPAEAAQCIAFSNRVAQSRAPVFLTAQFVSNAYSGVLETMSLPVWSRQRDCIWLVGASFPQPLLD